MYACMYVCVCECVTLCVYVCFYVYSTICILFGQMIVFAIRFGCVLVIVTVVAAVAAIIE